MVAATCHKLIPRTGRDSRHQISPTGWQSREGKLSRLLIRKDCWIGRTAFLCHTQTGSDKKMILIKFSAASTAWECEVQQPKRKRRPARKRWLYSQLWYVWLWVIVVFVAIFKDSSNVRIMRQCPYVWTVPALFWKRKFLEFIYHDVTELPN